MRVSAACAAVLLLGAVAGSAELDELKSRGVLRVIVAADEAPETFALRPGEDPGFERELVEGFARLQGLRVEAVTTPSRSLRLKPGDAVKVAVAPDSAVLFSAEPA